MRFTLSNFGIDPHKFISLRHIPKFISECFQFKKLGGKLAQLYPILTDYSDQAGAAKGHYFHQDLLVASYIYKNNPVRHIDIGSRIDGFVAHVAAFRKIDIMDVRELSDTGHENISFIQADLMNHHDNEITDSISCLHAIEHFGLGRYGDPLDVNGHLKGFNNILIMLKPNGILYISFPIGKQTAVQFNAHRIFHSKDVLNWALKPDGIKLISFDYVDDSGRLHRDVNINDNLNVAYGCGIYTFQKL